MNKNGDKRPARSEFVRTQSLRLPTPPPDPTKPSESNDLSTELIDKENEFLDYLNSLPMPTKVQQNDKPNLQRTTSIFAPVMATEDAFDHLDKLYKLMEQLLNLREQNAKLQRRVRDLEHLRNLQNLDQQVTSRVLRGEDTEIPELDDDSVLAEALLDNMFTSSRNKRSTKHKSPSQFRLRQSILRPQRDRSLSMAVDSTGDPLTQSIPRNASGKSLPERGILRKPSKVSKWTKVKAAFKWEKASPTVTGAKSQDSGIGGMLPVNNEIARYLRVPSTCDNPTEVGASPADSVISGSWNAVHGLSTPGTLSPASSTDDLNASAVSDHRSVSRTGSAGNSNASGKQFRTSRTSDEEEGERRSRSLDLTGSYCENSQAISKDDLIKLHANKAHKTPWGKVKDIIQTRKDSLKKKQHRLSARSDDCRTDYSAGSDQEDVFEAPNPPIIHDTPTVTVTNSEDIKEKQSNSADNGQKIPADVLARYQKVAAEEEKNQVKSSNGSPRGQRRVSKWTKVKKAFLTSTSQPRNDDDYRSMPASPTSKYSHFFSDIPPMDWKNTEDRLSYIKKSIDNLENRKLKEEIHKNYEQLQKKLSHEFQEKLQEWEKVKSSYNSVSSTAGSSQAIGVGGPTNEDQRDPEFVRKMEEWEKIKNQNNFEINKRKNLQMTSEENLPADFRKKLQEWQKIKKFGGKEDENVSSRKKKSEWQLWRSNSSNKQETITLGQPDGRQYSEDFLRKLDEWKQIKASHSAGEDQDQRKSLKENKSPSPGLSRNSSGNKLIRQNKNHKMQEWLEKELQKIEREKQRLEREREKFLEREERLAKLRRTIGNGPHKKDVLVQTSTGFYRFEGISRKFTQKLYEWEKARGIGPEDSTFALLSSGYNQMLPNPARTTTSNSYRHEPIVKLTRSKSMDSVANLTCVGSVITHQPSSLSLNDVEELEMQCLAESQSERNLNESEDNLDFGEPEAVIVEVEDFVEETAAPLEDIKESHHTPVYQTEVMKLCESEKCEAPEVRRSESARALTNYTLIEESLIILNKMREVEETCKVTETKINETTMCNQERESYKSTGAIPKRQRDTKIGTSLQDNLHTYYKQQSEMGECLAQKIQQLQETSISEAKYFTNKKSGFTISQLNETLNISQDLSAELLTIMEKLKVIFSERSTEFNLTHKKINAGTNNKYGQDISEMVDLLIVKIKELKRSLSYLCAASDMTAPGRRKKGSFKNRRSSFQKRASLDQITLSGTDKSQINDNTSDEEDQQNDKIKFPRRKEKLVKSKSEDNQMLNYAKLQVTSYGDNRKERSERCYQLNRSKKSSSQAILYTQSLDNKDPIIQNDIEKDTLEAYPKNRCHRKLIRTRRISDSQCDSNQKLEETSKATSTEEQTIDSNLIVSNSNVIIPTNVQYLDATSNYTIRENTPSSPVSIFVHTTRKLFTPFASEVFKQKNENDNTNETRISSPKLNENEINANNLFRRSHSPSESPLMPRKRRITITNNDNVKASQEEPKHNEVEEHKNNEISSNTPLDNQNSRPSTPSCLPPLPNSPIAQRRERLTKETSPAIRLMIARYNQKLSEQDNPGNKSAGSSGSASPVAWRSPVFERRVRTQTEKYEEEVNKTLLNTSGYSPLFMRKQVQKSASVGVIQSVKKQITAPEVTQRGISLDSTETNASPKLIRGILKSTSVGSLKSNPPAAILSEPQDAPKDKLETNETKTVPKITEKAPFLKLSIPPPKPPDAFKTSPNLKDRAHKLQKAKEEFLLQKTDTSSAGLSSAPFNFEKERQINYPARNRLSQVSFGSESSCDDMKYSGLLVKSASAGMINIDEATYEQFRPEIHSQGYVSLPRATKKKDGKFGISSLASKFRKVKMRRSKEPGQMNTITTLCRQSLVVDITGNAQENSSGSDDQNKKRNSQNRSSSSSDVHSPSSSKSSWIKNPSKIFKPKQ